MGKESPGPSSKLFELDNFIATPHIGAGTVEAQQYIKYGSLANKVINYMKSFGSIVRFFLLEILY